MHIALLTALPLEYRAAIDVFRIRDRIRCPGARAVSGTVGKHTVLCVKTGPGFKRSAGAASALCARFSPEIIIDSGTCAGLAAEVHIGDILISFESIRARSDGTGRARTGSDDADHFLRSYRIPESAWEAFGEQARHLGAQHGFVVHTGRQATISTVLENTAMKHRLRTNLGASGANWETHAVFSAAQAADCTAVSIRVVSDLGEASAIVDFFRYARPFSRKLYLFLHILMSGGWFDNLWSAE